MRKLLLLTALLTTGLLTHAEKPLIFASSLAVGEAGGLYAFEFDSQSGGLVPLRHTNDLPKSFFLAVSPNHRFLYATGVETVGGRPEDFVAAYALAGRGGELRRLNRQPSQGVTACYLDIDASGRTVTVANYTTGNVAALPVQADGSLSAAVSVHQHHGSSVDPKRQQGPHAHSIVISPDQRFAIAADLGLDRLVSYRLDATAATLTPNEDQPWVSLPPGTGPRHLAFHPNDRLLYALGELKNTVTLFDYAAETGRLTARQTVSTLPVGFEGISYTADVKITPDGQFLYGTNRGHDSIAAYRIATDGTLSLLALEPSLGKGPQNLLISPDGRWLLCANMLGNVIAVFQIEAATGRLQPTGNPKSIPMPSCLRWVP